MSTRTRIESAAYVYEIAARAADDKYQREKRLSLIFFIKGEERGISG